MSYDQNRWPLALDTALGANAWAVVSIHGTEALSDMFVYRVDALLQVSNQNVAAALLGKSVTLRIGLPAAPGRGLPPALRNGIVVNCTRITDADRSNLFRLVIMPWNWLLTRGSNCRIFQSATAPDLIKTTFNSLGFSAFNQSLQSTYPSLDYCVQYRETYFNFVSRLMEFNGIFYFYTHSNGSHVMQMADSNSACPAVAGDAEIPFGRYARGKPAGIDQWDTQHEIQPGLFTCSDFNYMQPTQNQTGKVNNSTGAAQANLEIFDFPGGFIDSSFASTVAAIRMQERQSEYEICSGTTGNWNVNAGSVFTLTGHPNTALNKKYLITGVQFEASQSEPAATGGASAAGAELTYSAHLTAIDFKQPYRPGRRTPKPVIAGPQTAFVSGPSGQEIYTDSNGRIKVQFHWDRYGQADQNASCWIRVAQLWAGKGWGALFLPRIGQEVVVEFVDGDPDRPLVTGCVYNAVNTTPYALPDKAAESGIKTSSTTGGNGANELKFDDTAGSENIFLHAQHDMHHRVKNNHYLTVEKENHMVIGGAGHVHHKDALHVQTDGKHLESIGSDRNLTVSGDEMVKIDGTSSRQVAGNTSLKFSAACYHEVAQQLYIKADTIVLEAATNITLKVGDSTIAIDSSGITIACGEFEVDGQSSAKISVGAAAFSLSSSDGKLAVGASSLDVSAGSAKLSAPSVSLGS
ncbi:MAG: type VI secretion system Vgr family protein [Phycisphaerae bacterium]